jgi:salicylate hydroxylase
VQREQLKTVLLDAIGDVDIHYGQCCTGYEAAGERVAATFESGAKAEADHLVGADGVASGVRARMIGDAPRFLGLSAIYGDAPIQPDDPLLTGGYFITLGHNGASFFCYTQPGGSVHWSYTMHTSAPGQLDASAAGELLTRVDRETAGWFPLVRRIVGATDDDSIGVRDYFDREPVKSIRSGRVWLVGDAAHPMSPFQGQGANCALANGVRLADYFAAAEQDPAGAEPVAAQIEAELVERSSKFVIESRKRAEQLHATSRYSQAMRDVGFRTGNAFIKLFSRGR